MSSLECSDPPVNTQIPIHIQVCPWCGVRATQWEPRVVSGVLLVRFVCWTGHHWSLTSIVDQVV
jgi:hypothetical protein